MNVSENAAAALVVDGGQDEAGDDRDEADDLADEALDRCR